MREPGGQGSGTVSEHFAGFFSNQKGCPPLQDGLKSVHFGLYGVATPDLLIPGSWLLAPSSKLAHPPICEK
jgi:hypothetical protein